MDIDDVLQIYAHGMIYIYLHMLYIYMFTCYIHVFFLNRYIHVIYIYTCYLRVIHVHVIYACIYTYTYIVPPGATLLTLSCKSCKRIV